jgi:hypothetical protein
MTKEVIEGLELIEHGQSTLKKAAVSSRKFSMFLLKIFNRSVTNFYKNIIYIKGKFLD